MSVLILSSSHIRRLERYIWDRPELRHFSLFNPPVINFLGISGGRITNSDHIDTFISSVRIHQPGHVLIHIGGNDLDSNGGDVQEIVFKLITFASTIIDRFDVSSVTICQLLIRDKTLKVPPEKYNKLVKEAKTLLKKRPKRKTKHILLENYWSQECTSRDI